MPDLSGFPALDVAIGLVFLYVLLSIVCSTVNELIAGALGWRARNLEVAVRNLLGGPAAERFWSDPRIEALKEPPRGRTGARPPSYVPARLFALTVLDTVVPDFAKRAKALQPDAPPSRDAVTALRESVDAVSLPAVKRPLLDALDAGRTGLDDLRAELETSFDEVMDRASGWYKRRTQRALLVIAVVVTLAGNVDSAQVAARLWNDEALRTAVVQRAIAQSDRQPPATGADLEALADRVGDVGDLGLPVGWGGSALPDSAFGWVGKVLLGWPATILALTLGAPFWFDVLGKFARLRATGNREGTEKDDDRAPEDRDDPSRRGR
jgi:hypothetical protein